MPALRPLPQEGVLDGQSEARRQICLQDPDAHAVGAVPGLQVLRQDIQEAAGASQQVGDSRNKHEFRANFPPLRSDKYF